MTFPEGCASQIRVPGAPDGLAAARLRAHQNVSHCRRWTFGAGTARIVATLLPSKHLPMTAQRSPALPATCSSFLRMAGPARDGSCGQRQDDDRPRRCAGRALLRCRRLSFCREHPKDGARRAARGRRSRALAGCAACFRQRRTRRARPRRARLLGVEARLPPAAARRPEACPGRVSERQPRAHRRTIARTQWGTSRPNRCSAASWRHSSRRRMRSRSMSRRRPRRSCARSWRRCAWLRRRELAVPFTEGSASRSRAAARSRRALSGSRQASLALQYRCRAPRRIDSFMTRQSR